MNRSKRGMIRRWRRGKTGMKMIWRGRNEEEKETTKEEEENKK